MPLETADDSATNKMEKYQQYIDIAIQYGTSYGLKMILALLVFWVGKRVARWITNLVTKGMRRNEIDTELIGFIDSLLYWGLFLVVIIAALGQLGVQTASFIAVLGAAGLAIGLALQGSLSNFAAGILIIILRPFRVGQFVDIAGESGSVEAIHIFTTSLITGDNKLIIIPNARVLDSNIVNHSATGTRRIDMVFGIGYDDDIDRAREVLREIVSAESRVLDEPETVIAVQALADSSVNFIVRPWVQSADYWETLRDITEQVKKRFDQENISFPFPQRAITMVNTSTIVKESTDLKS